MDVVVVVVTVVVVAAAVVVVAALVVVVVAAAVVVVAAAVVVVAAAVVVVSAATVPSPLSLQPPKSASALKSPTARNVPVVLLFITSPLLSDDRDRICPGGRLAIAGGARRRGCPIARITQKLET
jgi:hypothetical protein